MAEIEMIIVMYGGQDNSSSGLAIDGGNNSLKD